MKNTTFCILLAAALMMMGAIAMQLGRTTADNETGQTALAHQEEEESEMWIWPVTGAIVERFGPQYSAEHRQWTWKDEVIADTEDGAEILAPTDGIVEEIAGGEEGSCVAIRNEDGMMIRLWPAVCVRVFEGSHVEKGMMIGSTAGRISIRLEIDGQAVDPEKIFVSGNMS